MVPPLLAGFPLQPFGGRRPVKVTKFPGRPVQWTLTLLGFASFGLALTGHGLAVRWLTGAGILLASVADPRQGTGFFLLSPSGAKPCQFVALASWLEGLVRIPWDVLPSAGPLALLCPSG
jgi:hypothetical protein